MQCIPIQEGPYKMHGYYANLPSFVDGKFRLSEDEGGRYLCMEDTEESRRVNDLLLFYSRTEIDKGRRNGDSLMPFYLARAWTYLVFLLGSDLRGKKWCDMSAGWGVHLLTAMLTGMKYFSCDPNKAMHPVYRRMIEDYQGEATVIDGGFETDLVQPEEGAYDVFFSSPPYFDWEVYSDDEGQSIKKFPDFISWVALFLLPCLAKGVKSLKDNGYYLLYMQDVLHIRYCEAAIFYLHDYHPEMRYLGVISCGGKTKKYPTFIWRKDNSFKRVTGSYLDKYYARIYRQHNSFVNGHEYTAEFEKKPISIGHYRIKPRRDEELRATVADRTKRRGMEAFILDSEGPEVYEYAPVNYVFEEEVALIDLCAREGARFHFRNNLPRSGEIADYCMKVWQENKDFVYTSDGGPKLPVYLGKMRKEENDRDKKRYWTELEAYNIDRRNAGVYVIDYTMQITYMQQLRRSLQHSLPSQFKRYARCFFSSEHEDLYLVLKELCPDTTFIAITSRRDSVYVDYEGKYGIETVKINDATVGPKSGRLQPENKEKAYLRLSKAGDIYWNVIG